MATNRKKQPVPTSNGKPQKKPAGKKLDAKAPAAPPAPSADRITAAPPAAPPERLPYGAIKAYIYTDEIGQPLFRVLRTKAKKFYQQRLDVNGVWVDKLGDVRRVLYRLEHLSLNPEAPVVLVEGEKDAETMASLGFTATTNAMGGCNWRPEYSESLRGREVYLFPDNDPKGLKHRDVVRAALKGIAKKVVIVPMPDGKGKDVSDLHAGGATRLTFLEMMRAAELCQPAEDVKSSTPLVAVDGREVRLADWSLLKNVEQVPQKWLWKERIPSDAPTLLYGAPGVGKSFLSIDIAARVTRGKDFPDGRKCAEAGDVILLTGEDRIETTVKSRMRSAGGDEGRVAILRGTTITAKDGTKSLDPFALQDIRPLEEVADHLPNPKLVVIDPISMFSGGIDDHKNQEVRRMLGGLRTFCERREIAAIIITHPNKGQGPALNRIAGSIALGAAVRSAWCVCRDDEDTSGKNRLFLCAKPNLCEEPSGLSYQILRNNEPGAAATVSWGESPVMRTANEAMMDEQTDALEAREERRRLKREGENEGRVLLNMDKLPKDTEGYVAVKDIEECTGMNQGRLAQVIDSLQKKGIVEDKWNPIDLPRGGTRERGRRMVRLAKAPAKES